MNTLIMSKKRCLGKNPHTFYILYNQEMKLCLSYMRHLEELYLNH